MPSNISKRLLKMLYFLLVLQGLILWYIMVEILMINRVAPGRILGFACTYFLLGGAIIGWAGIGFFNLYKNRFSLLTLYVYGTYVIIGCEIFFGVAPCAYYSWSKASLWDEFLMAKNVYFHNIERMYGCCGVHNYKDYLTSIPSTCCGEELCYRTKTYKKKPGCIKAVKVMAPYYLLTGILMYGGALLQRFALVCTRKYLKQHSEKLRNRQLSL